MFPDILDEWVLWISMANVEVTGAARPHRAASVWIAGLAASYSLARDFVRSNYAYLERLE